MGYVVSNGQQRKRHYWLSLTGVIVTLAMLVAMVVVTNLHQQVARASSGDWPTLLGNLGRTGYNSNETAINPTTASNLKLQWTYHTTGNISSEPVVANSQVYWGSWDGNEYATDLTGKKLWSASIGGQVANCNPPLVFGVGSTATLADISINGTTTEVVFVGGQDATSKTASMFALNATTGAIIWETPLSSSTGSYVWSNPALYNGSIYVGLSSVDDCPLIRGALVQLDAATGTLEHTFHTVPSGCIGASIWGSPAIDENAGTIYIATGNNGPCSTAEPYAQALIELNAADLSLVDSWQVPPSQHGVDSDFGVTPTLFTAVVGGNLRSMVGVQNKNAIYYAFNRTAISAGPLWSAKTSTGNHSISSSAWDGTTLYIGSYTTTIGGKNCQGSLRALNPATGAFIWQDCFLDGPIFEPVSAVSGVIFVGEGPHFLAVNAATGSILFNYTTNGNIQGGAAISNGTVYVGNKGGNLYAFGVPSTFTPTPTTTSTVTPTTTPGTTIAQDDFQRPNQTHWGTASDGIHTWGADANSLSNFSITNNIGQITGSGSNGTTYNAVLGPTASNAEVVVAGSFTSFGTNTLGAALRWTDGNNFYKAYITGTNLVILKKVNGTLTRLNSVAFTATAGTSYTLDFSVVGTTLSAKVWKSGNTPPSTWMVTATDSSFSSGNCGIVVFLLNNVNADFTSFLATSQ
jgi:outer membrane protein assembly factor BamB